jgi:integrase
MNKVEAVRKPGPRPNRTDRNLTKRETGWYLEFQFRKKRIRRYGGPTKEAARNTLSKLRVDLINEDLGFKKQVVEPIAFATFADEFLKLHSVHKRSVRGDGYIIARLKEYFKGETLQTIGPEKIARYVAKRKTEVSPATVNRDLSCIKTVFAKAVEWGKISENPARTIKKLRGEKSRERILTADEADRLIKSASKSIRPVLITALNTAMRRNEILSLKWGAVNFQKRVILIEESKSGKSRNIPMNNAVHDALHDLPRVSEFIFYNSETKTHIRDIKNSFHAACRGAKKVLDDEKDPGIVGLRFHDLRHTAASKMIEAGVDLVTVSKILGHSSIQMTMRYCHPTPENMRKAVDLLEGMLDPSRQKVAVVKIRKTLSAVKRAH